jgi:hypothetical protein
MLAELYQEAYRVRTPDLSDHAECLGPTCNALTEGLLSTSSTAFSRGFRTFEWCCLISSGNSKWFSWGYRLMQGAAVSMNQGSSPPGQINILPIYPPVISRPLQVLSYFRGIYSVPAAIRWQRGTPTSWGSRRR